MENDTIGYFDSFFDGEGLADLLDPYGDIYIITMLDWKSVPRACPAPTMEDWKAFYANELEVIQKFESDKKKIVDALQAAMGKTFTDLFRETECDDGTLDDPIESLLPCQIWEKCKEFLVDSFYSPTSDFQLDVRPIDHDEEMKEYPDDAGDLLHDADECAAPGGSSNDQHCERGQQLVTVTPPPKQQHDGAVEDLHFRGVRWKPGDQDHAGGRTYPAKLRARAPAVPAQSEAAHANMQKQNMLLPQLVAHGGRGTVSGAILLPQLVDHGGRGTVSGAMAAKASAPAARCLRRLGGVTAARGRLRGY
mmetsp:Transcript_24032/g.36058  ORF Transcript_24032/g.36058 Transcript_24032/m.36058 type:complete len:307 (+) Transcript_24032:455-1375(+)